MIDHLAVEIIEENIDIPDENVLKEFKTFIINDRVSPRLLPGIMMIMFWPRRLHCITLTVQRHSRPRKRRKYNRMLHKNPSMMCPDGFMRAP